MTKKILLLEDDQLLAQTLEELLTSEGYNITLVLRGDDAIEASYEGNFDLYIFDINVPDISGLEILESLREAQDKTPTIFISALVDLESITKAFMIGADDYLKKPFFPQELLIRVNAKFSSQNSLFCYENLEYDLKSKLLKIDNKTIGLGEVQTQLLDLFINNQKKILDKDILLECLEKPSPTALRVAITKLKQTTGLNINNIRGVGYILE